MISVITICYNAEREIGWTVESVLSQSYKNIDYIIVDGGSVDSTLNEIEIVTKKYPTRNVKIISEPDKGIYDAMNKGIKRASGDWVCMMNAGDRFANNEVLANVFSKPIPANISFLYSDFYKATSFGRYFIVPTHCNEDSRTLVHQSVIYRKNLHERFGYYIVTPKIIISDYLFFLQIPVEETMKVDTVIAKYEGGGVSETGSWCKQQGLCANVVFRHGSFWTLYIDFLKWRLKHSIPLRWREWFRIKLLCLQTKIPSS